MIKLFFPVAAWVTLAASAWSQDPTAAPAAAARADVLLRSAPAGVHPQGFRVGVTGPLRVAIAAGLDRAGPGVPLDAAVRAGLPAVTGLTLPPDFAARVAARHARAAATRNRAPAAPADWLPRPTDPDAAAAAAAGRMPDPAVEWFDWRNLDCVTVVKNQGRCGCCWAFATAGAFEASYAVRNRRLVNASEQAILDCNTDGYSCQGGLWAFDLFASPGVPSGRLAPYRGGGSGGCAGVGGPYRVAAWDFLPNSATTVPPVAAIKQALCDHGPVAVAVDATPNFVQYRGGVFSEYASPYQAGNGTGLLSVNHAIVIVGWDDARIVPRDPSKTVWAVKNSWGPDWGVDQGFAWVRSDTNNLGNAAAYVEAAP